MKAMACTELRKLTNKSLFACSAVLLQYSATATASRYRLNYLFNAALLPACVLPPVLSTGALDGLFLDLHGAMGVAGRGPDGDAEAELVEALRAVVGTRCLVGASFDLHGNISERCDVRRERSEGDESDIEGGTYAESEGG